MKDRQAEDSSARETSLEADQTRAQGQVGLKAPPIRERLPVIPLATKGKHPYQVSPVAEYQTDRYRLVNPYTRL